MTANHPSFIEILRSLSQSFFEIHSQNCSLRIPESNCNSRFKRYTLWNNPLLKIQSFTVYLQMFFLKRKQALRLYLQKNINSSPAYIRGFSWWQPASNAKFRGLVILEIWLGLIFFYQITLKYLFQCYQKKHLQIHGINPESCADIRFINYTLWNTELSW